MNGMKSLVLIGLISNACGAQQVIITVTDDRREPVESIVYIDGMRLSNTDEYGVLSVTENQCGGGARVTVEPIQRTGDYITPSSTGYCIGEPVNVVLSRRIILAMAQQWATQATADGNWGLPHTHLMNNTH